MVSKGSCLLAVAQTQAAHVQAFAVELRVRGSSTRAGVAGVLCGGGSSTHRCGHCGGIGLSIAITQSAQLFLHTCIILEAFT